MSTDLMKRRYQCKNMYPNASRGIGEIIEADFATLLVDDPAEYDLAYYDNLFELLPWWKDRKPEDMPEYVKSLINQQFYKVVEKNEVSFQAIQGGWGINYPWDNVIPATKEEYELFISNKNQPGN